MRDQRGSATVLAIALSCVLTMVGLAGTWVGAVVVHHRAAQSAADLSALAGAAAIQAGRPPCSAAAGVALANQARLTDCDVTGSEVWIGVEVTGPPLLGRVPTLVGRAHAGPDEDLSSHEPAMSQQ